MFELFKKPEYRKFDLKPRYWNPEQEEREQREKRIKAELGIKDVKADEIMEVAKLACADGDTLGNMPFAVTPEDVYAAILGADALGRYSLGE